MASRQRPPTALDPTAVDPPDTVDVVVQVGGENVLAGRLYCHASRGTESATFHYDPAWLADSRGYPLEPALPLVGGPQHTETAQQMFRSFSDTAPDRWGRRLIERSERVRAERHGTPTRRLTEAAYLFGVRDDLRQGAIRFRDPATGAYLAGGDTGVPAVADLPHLLEVAGRVEQDDAQWEELREMLRVGSSLGGARPKAHVVAPDGQVAIAKFPSANYDTWNVMAWEKTALDLAALAGITVPTSTLITVAGRQVLIVDRFDRAGSKDARIGYVSALTMLEARDGEAASYLDIGAAIEQVSPTATKDLRQLWRRAALGILISNTDDHLRNHGFLHVGGGAWSLSPAFDLNPNPDPGPKYLATAVAEPADPRARLDLLLAVAPQFRLSDAQARSVLHDVVSATMQWRQVAAGNGLGTKEVNMMLPAFEHDQAAAAREHLDAGA